MICISHRVVLLCFPIVFLWLAMGSLWFSCGYPMVPTDFMWTPYVLLRFRVGSTTVLLWACYGFAMVYHGPPMVLIIICITPPPNSDLIWKLKSKSAASLNLVYYLGCFLFGNWSLHFDRLYKVLRHGDPPCAKTLQDPCFLMIWIPFLEFGSNFIRIPQVL